MAFPENHIVELKSVDSTNSYSERLLKEKEVQEGTAIWAHEQSAGKGQGKNTWLSEPYKNLTFSLILHPRFLPIDQQFYLNKVVSLGILDFIKMISLEKEFRIKWPNDIYFKYSKLGGVLINVTISGSLLETAIIGIGININQTRFDTQLPNPVSLRQITNIDFDLKEVLNKLINQLYKRYEMLKNGMKDELDEEYKSNLLGIQVLRNYNTDKGSVEGIIIGVDSFGRLILKTGNGTEMIFAHKEIEYIF